MGMGNYVTKIKVENFKKFQNNEFQFERGVNVLVGDNDAGKSSILKAIDIVLNQSGTDDRRSRSSYGTLMNKSAISEFLNGKQEVDNLPQIVIEAWLSLDDNLASSRFDGMQNSENRDALGIRFIFEFDESYKEEFEYLKQKELGKLQFLPFELYRARWTTFAGQSYTARLNPLKSIFIDTDRVSGDSFSNYTHQLFAAMDPSKQHEIGVKLKSALEKVHTEIHKDESRLGIDVNRIKSSDFLEGFSFEEEQLIPLRDMGSGTENTIKTELALDTEAKLVLVEEPENHLSFTLARKQIENLHRAEAENRQVIVTTHSPLIVNRMSLSTVRWLKENKDLQSFSNLDPELVSYFKRMDNVDLLQILLSRKLILVEGPTEYILMESMVKSITGMNIEELGIHIMSMHGDHYKRFTKLAKEIKNRVLIITDNDSNDTRIDSVTKENESENIKIAMPDSSEQFTFKVALYEKNKEFINNKTEFKESKSKENNKWKTHENLSAKLVYMLDHKVDSAINPTLGFISSKELAVPDYIIGGIEWLIQ